MIWSPDIINQAKCDFLSKQKGENQSPFLEKERDIHVYFFFWLGILETKNEPRSLATSSILHLCPKSSYFWGGGETQVPLDLQRMCPIAEVEPPPSDQVFKRVRQLQAPQHNWVRNCSSKAHISCQENSLLSRIFESPIWGNYRVSANHKSPWERSSNKQSKRALDFSISQEEDFFLRSKTIQSAYQISSSKIHHSWNKKRKGPGAIAQR